MEEKRLKQFTFYDLYYEALKGLSDEAAGRMAKNICKFMFSRRSYEERNKDKRKQASGNFGTMIPRDLFDEINAFLKERNMTKVDFIRTAYEIMKSGNSGTHN